jgi:hypothetical protein
MSGQRTRQRHLSFCSCREKLTNMQLTITTTTDKLNPVYKVKATFTTPQKQTKLLEFDAPFARWFSSDGYFITKPFQQFFASGIPLVGDADPKNVVEEVNRSESGNTSQTTARDAGQPIIRDFGVTLENLPGVLDAIKAQGGKADASPRQSNKSRKKA